MKKHILCLGDSNTHGCDAESGGRFDESQRWTSLLGAKLGEGCLVIEEGLSGRTTVFDDPLCEGLSALDYLYPCMMSHEPLDLLIIMLGTNDTKERFQASPACIALGLSRLIEKAKSATECWRDGKSNILVIAPRAIDKKYEDTEVFFTMGRECAEKSAKLAREFKKTADRTGCRFFDAGDVVSDYNHVDYMHLTAEGHRQLAEALAQLIPALL